MKAVFVAGSGTEVGKTYVTASLARSLRCRGRSIRVLKPLASGLPSTDDPAFAASDPALLLAAAGLPVTEETLDACCPWRFAAPLSPDMAAAAEGRCVTFAEVVAWVRGALSERSHDVTLLEGVGGTMSPITADATGLDLAGALGAPVLLVCGTYLGAISHGLTALTALWGRGLEPLGLVVNESCGAGPPFDATVQAFRRLAGKVEVHPLRRGEALNADALGI